MQTRFFPEALKEPAMQASEKILRTCVHCGFCTATCPTYLLLGDELDSPRGRIYMIKDMLERGQPASADVVKHVDRCLSCLSCMTTCPSGVDYMHLVDHARAHVEATYQRPFADRALRMLLAKILPYPWRFRVALALAGIAKSLTPVLKSIPDIGPRIEAIMSLLPKTAARHPLKTMRHKKIVPSRGRVAVLKGCAQSVLDPGINDAAKRVLNRMGIEIVEPKGEGCCGALVHHMGREAESHSFAKRNIDAWIKEMDGAGLDAIVITTSGCGTTIKDYGHMFRNDPAYSDKAARVSAIAKDITEVIEKFGLPPIATVTGRVVAYHSACSMQHGQQLRDGPKAILKQAGFIVKDVPEGHICCGSAGTYNMLQPELSGQLRARKVGNILKMKPDVIATGNLGCITQIGKGIDDVGYRTPVVHTIELVDWATGGPPPRNLIAPN
jgi:glycolate oxidase iron-sulfur subunit